MVAPMDLAQAKVVLVDPNSKLDARIHAMYVIKNVEGKTIDGARVMIEAVDKTTSVLLQHELLYNLGQFQLIGDETKKDECEIITFIKSVIANTNYHPVSRHEAVEALGAIFASGYYTNTEKGRAVVDDVLTFLKAYLDPSVAVEVRESAELALARIKNAPRGSVEHPIAKPSISYSAVSKQHPYVSIDPSPAFSLECNDDVLMAYKCSENLTFVQRRVELVSAILLNKPLPVFGNEIKTTPASLATRLAEDLPAAADNKYTLWDRYRAMFSLRNIGGEAVVKVLCDAMLHDTISALFRHEVAFVLGQLESPASMPMLRESVWNEEEHAMVRHEAAEAVGACADCGWDILEKGAKCSEPIVADSCIVAMEMHKYWAQFKNLA